MKIKVFDNHGVTVDRYRVMIFHSRTKGASYFTMSANPLSPLGVNQYLGHPPEQDFEKDEDPIKFKNLPEPVKKAIRERVKNFKKS